jgi:hypothetical protein
MLSGDAEGALAMEVRLARFYAVTRRMALDPKIACANCGRQPQPGDPLWEAFEFIPGWFFPSDQPVLFGVHCPDCLTYRKEHPDRYLLPHVNRLYAWEDSDDA